MRRSDEAVREIVVPMSRGKQSSFAVGADEVMYQDGVGDVMEGVGVAGGDGDNVMNGWECCTVLRLARQCVREI